VVGAVGGRGVRFPAPLYSKWAVCPLAPVTVCGEAFGKFVVPVASLAGLLPTHQPHDVVFASLGGGDCGPNR
jgi:hypothetical protein